MPASFVGSNFNGATSGTSANLPLGSLVTGQTLFVAVCALGSGNVPSSVTDNQGNSYSLLYTQNFSAAFLGGSGGTISLYVARIATSASTTVTVNFASSTTFEINANWFVGFNTAPFTVETSVSAGGTGTVVSSGVTPSNAAVGDLVLGIGISTIPNGDFAHFFTQGAGWTFANDSSGDPVSSFVEFQNAASTTTFTATATLNSSFAWVMACVAIKQTATAAQFVRNYGTVHSAGASSLNLTSVTLSAGDLGILCIKWVSGGGVLISSVTDNLGNIWVAIPGTYQFLSASGFSSQLYTCLSITTGGTATITVTWAASVTSMDIGGSEFSSSIRDVVTSTQNSGGGANPTLNVTPAQANEMIYAFFVDGAGSPTVGAGFINAGSAGANSLQEYMQAGLGNVSYSVPSVSGSSAVWTGAAVTLGPGGTNKSYNFDAFINPFFNSRIYSFDAFIIDPTKRYNFDAFIQNPSGITVVESFMNLAGNILFKVNNPNGFMNLIGTIAQPVRSFIKMLGTIKGSPLIYGPPMNLGGTIVAKTRNYIKLAGTISNPTLRSWNFDALIATPIRTYMSLAGTIIQRLQQTGPPVPTGAYPDSSYMKLRGIILNPASTKDSIQMPGAGYTTADDWYSSVDAGASYKPGSVFNISGASLPVGGINLVISAFTGGVCSFQTRTRTWLRRVDAAPNGVVVSTSTNMHTLPNGAVITTTTVVTQNQDVTTTTITTQSSATPTRTSIVVTEKSVGGQTTTREIDTNTINGVVTNQEKKTVFSIPPTTDNPQPLKVTTLDGIIHYQFFSAINVEWAGLDQEGVTQTQSQTQVVPGTLNGQSTDSFGNPILSKITSSSTTTPDGKVITTTTTDTGSSIAKDYGTIVTDTVNQFVGIQKTTITKTTYPDGSVVTNTKVENSLTGESTETNTETVTDEYGQITITTTTTDTKVFTDPASGALRQTVTKTVAVNKGGVTTTDSTVTTTNDFEDSIINQKIKVYFIQEYTITCVIDEQSLFALSDLNITQQKNYALLELFGQQLGNANLSWALRNKLINQFNLANASIVPVTLQALGKTFSVVFAQSASSFRSKYIPGTEPHVYELQMILQSRSDMVTGTFGF